MKNAPPLPFALTLHPLLPLRTPEHGCDTLTFGYQLRLPDGPALATDDPLLSAFAAIVVPLVSGGEREETLQHEAFDPGRRLSLVPEGLDEDGDAVVGVWDADGIRRAGVVPYIRAPRIVSAIEHGLAMRAVALTEERTLLDDRRASLELLVRAPALVRVDPEADDLERVARPERPRRERVVLLADGTSELRWWDPSGGRGPMHLSEPPVSDGLATELQKLSQAYVRAARDDDAGPPDDPMESMERDWARSTLESRTHELWLRARGELGRRYAIGLLGPGMSRPAWSVGEAGGENEDGDEDTPF